MEAMREFLLFVAVCCGILLLPCAQAAAWDAVPWTEPVPLSELNGTYHDKSPFLSFDGLSLYFSVEPGWGYTRVYQAVRPRPSGPFVAVGQISGLNYPMGHVSSPWVSADNLRMYYYRTEVGGKRLRLTRRSSASAQWTAGGEIPELNRLGDLANPTLTRDERIIVFSGHTLVGGRGDWDLWMARRPYSDQPFGDIQNLESLNTSAADMHPSITPDGLTLYFSSNRNGEYQLFRAARAGREDAFGPPEHLTMFDTPGGNSCYPHLSADGRSFFFSRREQDTDYDICVSYRPINGTNFVELLRLSDPDGMPAVVMTSTSVQEAIDAAQDGDTVNVYAGLYGGAIHFAGKAITVRGIGGATLLEAPGGDAVSFHRGEGPDSVLKNVVICNSAVGILISGAAPTITNVTVAGNEFGVEAYQGAESAISNSIFWGNLEGDLYGCQARYSCIERFSEGQGNISVDPLFVDPNGGDYHLRSARGRYWPEHDVWVLDDVTSPCVDAGDPAADFSQERRPNGGRLNMGAYGGSPSASMSESVFQTDFNGDHIVDADDLEQFTEIWDQELESATPLPR